MLVNDDYSFYVTDDLLLCVCVLSSYPLHLSCLPPSLPPSSAIETDAISGLDYSKQAAATAQVSHYTIHTIDVTWCVSNIFLVQSQNSHVFQCF